MKIIRTLSPLDLMPRWAANAQRSTANLAMGAAQGWWHGVKRREPAEELVIYYAGILIERAKEIMGDPAPRPVPTDPRSPALPNCNAKGRLEHIGKLIDHGHLDAARRELRALARAL